MIKNFVIIFNCFTVVALGIYVLYDWRYTKKAYVINETVFEEFEGKKELELRLKQIKLVNQRKLDSLTVMAEKEKNNKELAELYRNLLSSSRLQEEELTARYTSDIWRHINEGIADFGRAEGYDFIFGASGNGTIMYADETHDVTTQVVAYLNARYNQELEK